MSILSADYLVFVLAAIAVYYLLPLKIRKWALLGASMVFYGFAGWRSAAYLLAMTLMTWAGALFIERKRRKGLLILILLVPLGGMALIKYGETLVSALAAVFSSAGLQTKLSAWTLFVPLGLSWFTFQSAGYVIDVYRGKVRAEKNICRYALFVSFFPQLTQGPISTWAQLAPQLNEGHFLQPAKLVSGFQLMLWGYFKKLVIADRLAAVTAVLAAGQIKGFPVLIGAFIYALRLYADFSGGMDVIRGTALTFGIQMPENFRRPFFSKSVTDYWRRWHITLGAWFRSYVLYPLTTSRFGMALSRIGGRLVGKKVGRLLPAAFATLLIFLLIGIWHTANLNALLYGLYFGLLMSGAVLLEPIFKRVRKRLSLPGAVLAGFRLIRTWLLVAGAQFFAVSESPAQAFQLMASLFEPGSLSPLAAALPAAEWGIVLVGFCLVLVVDLLCERGKEPCDRLSRARFYIRWPLMLLLIFSVLVLGCYGEGFNGAAFLYTQF